MQGVNHVVNIADNKGQCVVPEVALTRAEQSAPLVQSAIFATCRHFPPNQYSELYEGTLLALYGTVFLL